MSWSENSTKLLNLNMNTQFYHHIWVFCKFYLRYQKENYSIKWFRKYEGFKFRISNVKFICNHCKTLGIFWALFKTVWRIELQFSIHVFVLIRCSYWKIKSLVQFLKTPEDFFNVIFSLSLCIIYNQMISLFILFYFSLEVMVIWWEKCMGYSPLF